MLFGEEQEVKVEVEIKVEIKIKIEVKIEVKIEFEPSEISETYFTGEVEPFERGDPFFMEDFWICRMSFWQRTRRFFMFIVLSLFQFYTFFHPCQFICL
jgi:hypothetical protein